MLGKILGSFENVTPGVFAGNFLRVCLHADSTGWSPTVFV